MDHCHIARELALTSRIRELSSLGRAYHWERQMNFVDRLKVADIGDCPIVPIDVAKTYKSIEKYFAKLKLSV